MREQGAFGVGQPTEAWVKARLVSIVRPGNLRMLKQQETIEPLLLIGLNEVNFNWLAAYIEKGKLPTFAILPRAEL